MKHPTRRQHFANTLQPHCAQYLTPRHKYDTIKGYQSKSTQQNQHKTRESWRPRRKFGGEFREPPASTLALYQAGALWCVLGQYERKGGYRHQRLEEDSGPYKILNEINKSDISPKNLTLFHYIIGSGAAKLPSQEEGAGA